MVLLVLFLLFSGCSTKPAKPIATAVPFNRNAMLRNFTRQLILPAHQNLETAASALTVAAQTFVANPDQANLDTLQQAWLEVNLARMATTPYNFGPVHDSLLHNRLDKRPIDVSALSEILAGEATITADYIGTIGSNKVGLGAIEYLIFDPENGDTAVLTAFQNSSGERRQALLLALAQNVQQTTVAVQNIWGSDGANYAQWFVESSGEMENPMNVLVNQMLADLEMLINTRLGTPLGKQSDGIIQPEQVEAPYSHMSLPRMIATIETLKIIFSGGGGLGLDDYLDFLQASYEDQPLSQAILNQFDTTLLALNAIDEPLETAVANNPAQTEAAYDELKKLLVLLKVDMVNHLGIILTFNDNDGD